MTDLKSGMPVVTADRNLLSSANLVDCGWPGDPIHPSRVSPLAVDARLSSGVERGSIPLRGTEDRERQIDHLVDFLG